MAKSIASSESQPLIFQIMPVVRSLLLRVESVKVSDRENRGWLPGRLFALSWLTSR